MAFVSVRANNSDMCLTCAVVVFLKLGQWSYMLGIARVRPGGKKDSVSLLLHASGKKQLFRIDFAEDVMWVRWQVWHLAFACSAGWVVLNGKYFMFILINRTSSMAIIMSVHACRFPAQITCLYAVLLCAG